MKAQALQIFPWAIFPFTLGGTVALAIWQMGRGASPELAALVGAGIAYVLLLALERVVPYHESWKHSRGDIHVDLLHALVSGFLTLEALRPLVVAGAVMLGAWLSAWIGIGLWPGGWHLVPQLVLALVVGEFFLYWAHRLGHEWPWLWRLHAMHHSAPRLYFLNAARFHPIDLAISHFIGVIPLVILGAGAKVLALFVMVSAVHGLFQHANIPIRCGPLNYFFSMSELHRWHHSTLIKESDTNYGQNLIVWDIVFGTRFLPRDREPPETIGIGSMPDFPMDYWGQLLSPIRWSRFS